MSNRGEKYIQLYHWLLTYIDENRFSDNYRLPSENALCTKFQVSRDTVRSAVDMLVQDGIAYKIKGSGTYFHKHHVPTRSNPLEVFQRKIGVILQGQDTDANAELLAGIRNYYQNDSVDLRIFLTDNKFANERRCLQTVACQDFDGFIVDGVKASIASPNLDCYKELYRREIPVIFYNNYYRDLKCPGCF